MVEMITESSAALPLHHQQYKQWKPSQYSDQWLHNTEIQRYDTVYLSVT